MNRIYLIIVSLLLSCSLCQAQNVIFKIGGGLASHAGSSTRNIGAFKLGASYEWELNNLWGVETGLYYFAKGWKNKDRDVIIYDEEGNPVVDEDGNVLMGKMNITSNANYIELPVLVNYYIPLAGAHYLSLSAGPYFAYGIGGKVKTNGDTDRQGVERLYHEHSTFSQSGMHRFDVGAQVSANYELNRQFSVGISADWGLTKVSSAGGKNVSYILSLAYKFSVNQ